MITFCDFAAGPLIFQRSKSSFQNAFFFLVYLKKSVYFGYNLSVLTHILYLAFLHYHPCIPLSPLSIPLWATGVFLSRARWP